jgi:hypothetical protein
MQLPLRVFPGRLSVSRTFGDASAKLPQYEGNPNVVIAVPDVRSLRLTPAVDFVVAACDGVFDALTNQNVVDIVWRTARAEAVHCSSIHEICGKCVEQILTLSMENHSLDNVTVILIVFSSFVHALQGELTSKALPPSKLPTASRNEPTHGGLFISCGSPAHLLFHNSQRTGKAEKDQQDQLYHKTGQPKAYPTRATVHLHTPSQPSLAVSPDAASGVLKEANHEGRRFCLRVSSSISQARTPEHVINVDKIKALLGIKSKKKAKPSS